jgi:hypothetical protein
MEVVDVMEHFFEENLTAIEIGGLDGSERKCIIMTFALERRLNWKGFDRRKPII